MARMLAIAAVLLIASSTLLAMTPEQWRAARQKTCPRRTS
jgi:hypothetical protein